jgi:competence protein ComEC
MGLLISIVSGFASGVFLRSLFAFGWAPIIFVSLLAAIFGGAIFFGESRRAYSLGAMFCIFIALGMLRTTIADTPLPDTFATQLRQRVTYEGVVVADPDVRDANERVQIRVSDGSESTTILAVVPRNSEISVGDQVSVSGTLSVPQPFATDGGRTFRYDKYLERDGVRFMLNFAFIRVTRPAPWYSLPAALARAKHAFLNGLSATLPEPYASLAGGVVIGGKSGLGKELQDAFVRSGLVQIIVLSGYNVMIVAEWIMTMLSSVRISRRWSSLAGSIAILLFVGIAGASATALRAMFMAFIALFARATGRTYAAGRALLFVVLLMLVWNPLYLAFDPGFGLSVVATAGLIWLAPTIEMLLARMKNAAWRDMLATTLAAQIAVLPLLLYDTGNLSLVAIPANLFTMPITPLVMGLSIFAGMIGMIASNIAPMIGIVLAYPAYLANAYLILIAQKAAELPLASFTLPSFPFWLVLFGYAALIFIASSKRFSTTLQLRFARKAST